MCRLAVLLCLLCCSSRMWAQAGAPAPEGFEAVTIKEARGEGNTGLQISRNRFYAKNASVVDLIKYAYGVHSAQIIGVPEAVVRERFDIEAVAATDKMPQDGFRSMVRGLLQSRFQLASHADTRVLCVYLLTLDAGGRLTPTMHPDNLVASVGHGSGTLTVNYASLKEFAAFLQRFVTDRPVLDRTALPGKFDMQLRWKPEEGAAPADSAAGRELPGLFTAIREQLGLRLQAAREMDDVMVIDSVSHPTAD